MQAMSRGAAEKSRASTLLPQSTKRFCRLRVRHPVNSLIPAQRTFADFSVASRNASASALNFFSESLWIYIMWPAS